MALKQRRRPAPFHVGHRHRRRDDVDAGRAGADTSTSRTDGAAGRVRPVLLGSPRRVVAAARRAPGAPGAQGRGGGRGGPSIPGGPQMSDPAYATADFTKKDPVLPLTPAQQAAKFQLPPGYKMTPVLTDPDIQEAAQIAFDGNGRMFVLETPQLHAGRRWRRHAHAERPHLHARRPRQRRRLRDPQGLRRQPDLPALRDALRRQRGADEGIERRRALQVHRHQQRRRRRQEGALRDRVRAPRERRAPGSQPHVGDGQLAVQHDQPVPHSCHATGRRARVDRFERRAVGRDAG